MLDKKYRCRTQIAKILCLTLFPLFSKLYGDQILHTASSSGVDKVGKYSRGIHFDTSYLVHRLQELLLVVENPQCNTNRLISLFDFASHCGYVILLCQSRVLITCTDNGRLSYWPDEQEKVSIAIHCEVKLYDGLRAIK